MPEPRPPFDDDEPAEGRDEFEAPDDAAELARAGADDDGDDEEPDDESDDGNDDESDDDDDATLSSWRPRRRRFYSSDIMVQSTSRFWTRWPPHRVAHDQGREEKNPSGLNDCCSHWRAANEYEPEPLSELDHVAVRRRTCSETFTKNSRVPLSFFHHVEALAMGDWDRWTHDKEWTVNQMDKEKEEKKKQEKEEKKKQEVGELLMGMQWQEEVVEAVDNDRIDMSAGDRVVDGSCFLSSSSWRRTLHDGLAAGFSPAEWTHAVESEEKKLEKLRNLQKLYQEGFITVTEYTDRRVQLVDELSEADQSMLLTFTGYFGAFWKTVTTWFNC